MLALDRAVPGIYQNLGAAQLDHTRVQTVERTALGADHAEVGAWLLETWNFPQHLVYAVAGSHDPEISTIGAEYRSLARCAAVSGKVAEIFWREDYEQTSREAADMAEKACHLPGAHFYIDLISAAAHKINGNEAQAQARAARARERKPNLTSAMFFTDFPYRQGIEARERMERALSDLGF